MRIAPGLAINTLILAVAGLPACGARTSPATQPAQAKLALVTWNIHGCRGGLDAVVSELKRLNADILCLQEAESDSPLARGFNQAARIAERLGMHCASAGSPLSEGGKQEMAIFTRMNLQEANPLDGHTGRIYGIAAVVSWNGRPLRVVSVHLTGTYQPSLEHAFVTSAKRSEEAADLVRRLAEWTEDTLVAGDFNAIPGAGVDEQVQDRLRRAPTTQPTYPSTSPALQLDHVYHSDGMLVRPGPEQSSIASDHLPVVVDVARRASPPR